MSNAEFLPTSFLNHRFVVEGADLSHSHPTSLDSINQRTKRSVQQIQEELAQQSTSLTKKGRTVRPTKKSSSLPAFVKKQRLKLGNILSNWKSETFSPTRPLNQSSWLKEKGYQELSKQLHQMNYPWKELKAVDDPILIEQLTRLFFLCQHSPLSNQTKPILDFAFKIALLAAQSNKNERKSFDELQRSAQHVLGQLTYLVDQHPDRALKCVRSSSYQEGLDLIAASFTETLSAVCQRLNQHHQAHEKFPLQSPKTALYTAIPIEVAKLFITTQGTVNIGITDSLVEIFSSFPQFPSNQKAHLSYILNLLKNSPSLREQLENIQAPCFFKQPSHDLIRASLRLSPETEITAREARQAVLAAWLSHLRQEGHSCFATSLAIEVLAVQPEKCLKDLAEIIERSALTRNIKGIKKEIPTTKKVWSEDLNQELTFDATGQVFEDANPSIHLAEIPGLQRVCQALGIKDISQAMNTFASSYAFKASFSQETLSAKALIRSLCIQAQQSPSLSSKSLDELLYTAYLAYSSETAQPLLRSWENAIANMAEAKQGSMIKTMIMGSVLSALQMHLSNQCKVPQSSNIRNLFIEIRNLLLNDLQLYYDPSVGEDLEKHSKQDGGGFVLYYHDQRIDSADAFQNLIASLVEEADKKWQAHAGSSQIINNQGIIHSLVSYAHSSNFILEVLKKYHPSNASLETASLHFDQIKVTPWITQTGHNSRHVLEIYFENDSLQEGPHLKPENAEQRLINLVELARHHPDIHFQMDQAYPNKLIQLRIPGAHTASLMLGHPTFARLWQSDNQTQEWLKKFVHAPSQHVAHFLLTPISHQHLLHDLNELVNKLEEATVSKTSLEHKRTIQESFLSLRQAITKLPQHLTIKQSREILIETFKVLGPSFPVSIEKFAREVDTALYRCLPSELKKQLESSVIHFADTNWAENGQDLHLCFLANPGTSQLEVWECCADGSNLKALDQKYWLLDSDWELFFLDSVQSSILDK